MNKIKNINKYVLLAGVTGTLLLSATLIYAQTYNTEELREKAQMRAEQTKEQVQTLREQAKGRVKQAKADVQEKIRQIKDQRKQEAANKIAKQLDHLNQVWTDHFINVLDRLDAILQKVKSRTEKASANGKDVLAVKTAIQNAESKIASARTAVASQAQKTYTVNATAVTQTGSTANDQNNLVSSLREQFKALKDQLMGDLKSLRDGAMKDSRNAVQDAFKALSQVLKVDEEPSGSNSQ